MKQHIRKLKSKRKKGGKNIFNTKMHSHGDSKAQSTYSHWAKKALVATERQFFEVMRDPNAWYIGKDELSHLPHNGDDTSIVE